MVTTQGFIRRNYCQMCAGAADHRQGDPGMKHFPSTDN